jgi:uncharacterized membrane protein YdjX (TVP38/TMEM64 family)
MSSDKTIFKTIINSPLYRRIFFLGLLITVCIVATCWHFAPVDQWRESEEILSFLQAIRINPLAPLIIISFYVIGGLLVFPVIALIPLTAFILGPLPGFFYSAVGLFANASVLYALGYLVGYKTVQQLSGTRTHQLSQQLSRNGILTILTLRFFPVVPFTVISLIAGASHINYREYIFGTLLGIIPALAVMTLVGNQLARIIINPDAKNFTIAIVGGTLLMLAFAWLRHLKKAG